MEDMIPGLTVIFYNCIGINDAAPPQGVALFEYDPNSDGRGTPISDSGTKKQWKVEFLWGCSINDLSGRCTI
jgi:hypothetical protein